MSINFPKCDSDVRITHIGRILIRRSDKSFWPSVEIWGSPPQHKNGFHTVRLSNMASLYRGKILNKENLLETFSDKGTIRINANHQIRSGFLSQFTSLSDYDSLRDVEGKQHAFIINTPNKVEVIVPQLEFARVLFYSSSYLARASLTSSTLINDFYVKEHFNAGVTNIQVLNMRTFPRSAFDDPATKAMLSWILINRDGRRSFESIFKYFNQDVEATTHYNRWVFQFDLPDLLGWSIGFKGRYNPEKTQFLVEKIESLRIDANMPGRVFFHNKLFTHPDDEKPVKQGGKGKEFLEVPPDHTIDDENEASNDNGIVSISDIQLSVSFINPFVTAKSTEPKLTRRPSEVEEQEQRPEVVSTQESSPDGDIPGADLAQMLEDETDHTEEYAGRFKAFDLMIQTLVANHKCEIVAEITQELPQVGKSRCHLINNETSRAIRCVLIRKRNVNSFLLEVDVTGMSKWLSTRCIRQSVTKSWTTQFTIIKKGLVKKSLAWPIDQMNESFGEENHLGISHPHSIDVEQKGIPTDSIAHWSTRVYSRL